LDTRRLMVGRERRGVSTGIAAESCASNCFTDRGFLLCASDGECRGYARASSSIPGASRGSGCPELLIGQGFLSRGGNARVVVTRDAPANMLARLGVSHSRSSGLRTPSARRSARASTLLSYSRPHGRAAPARCECRSRLPEDGSRMNGASHRVWADGLRDARGPRRAGHRFL